MNILLIYPEFPNTFWSFKHALEFLGKRAMLPPLGMVTIAAMLPRNWSLRLVDTNVQRLTEKDLAWADCAFISAMIVQRESAHRMITRCREHGLRIVAGGPLFQNEHEAFADVDHFILNEAELTLPGFLKDLAQGNPSRVYSCNEHADLRQTPQPRWELLDLRRYASMSIQFSRGCPFNCDFCNVTVLLGHRVRTKSSKQIIAELDSLYAQGWRDEIFFVDDNFIGNVSLLKHDLLPALIAWRQGKPGIRFFTEASINLSDDRALMEMMVEAGFNRVFIGIETPNEESLAECSKIQNRNRDLVTDIKNIQRAGLQVLGGFIVGFDHDRQSIFQRQIDLIQRSSVVTAMVGMLQAPPGTRLYERMKKENRLCGDTSGDNVDGTTNIIPVMSLDALRRGYLKIMHHIYSPEHYYKRVSTFLCEYPSPRTRGPLRLSHFLAFLRSFYRLGLAGPGQVHYWKLLLWTQWHRPRLMSTAIQLAIYGYHFRKVCEQRVR